MLTQPYIAYMRDAAGGIFRIAWALKPGGEPLPFETAFGSSRYLPDNDASYVEVGEQRTTEFVRSPYAGVPARVCSACYVGEKDWFSGTWPDDAPPVVLADDGWAVDCDGRCFMCLKRVGLAAADTFEVTNSPLTSDGTISLDWVDVDEGKILGRAPGAGTGEPTFIDIPSSGPVIGKLTSGPIQNPNVQTPVCPSTWSSVSSIVQLTNPTDISHFQPSMLLLTSGLVPIGYIVQCVPLSGVTPAHLVLYAPPSSGSGGDVVGQLLTLEWVEQQIDPDSGALSDKPGGIVGTPSSNPCTNLEINYVNPNQCYAFMWPEPNNSVGTLWRFSKYGNDLLNPGSTGTGPINTTPPTGTPAPNPSAPGDFYYDPVTNNYVFNFSGGVSLSLPSTGGGQYKVLKYIIDFSAFPPGLPQTITLDTFLANQFILWTEFRISVAWAFPFSSTIPMQFGWANGPSGTFSTTFYGSHNVSSGGVSAVEPNATLGFTGPHNIKIAAGGTLTATLQSGGGNPTAGQVELWVGVATGP